MKIALASDHAGFKLKEEIKNFLIEIGHEIFDFGTDSIASVDYPDFALAAAKAVSSEDFERAILVCGSGIGMAMSANKVHGIRAAACNDLECAVLSRKHNDANILTLGSRLIDLAKAKGIIETWLSEEFEGGRHERRIEKMTDIENERSTQN